MRGEVARLGLQRQVVFYGINRYTTFYFTCPVVGSRLRQRALDIGLTKYREQLPDTGSVKSLATLGAAWRDDAQRWVKLLERR